MLVIKQMCCKVYNITLLSLTQKKVKYNISVIAEMLLHLLLLLVLPLSNCESSKETVKDDLEETMFKSEKLKGLKDKVEELEKKLETKNAEVENLQEQLKEVKVQLVSGGGQSKEASCRN